MSKDDKKVKKTVQERMEELTPGEKDLWLVRFFMLCQEPKFTDFVNKNFSIETGFNDETKGIETVIIDKNLPPERPSVTPVMRMKLLMLLQSYGCGAPRELSEKVINLVEGRKVSDVKPLISSATSSDLDQVIAEQKSLKSKLDT